MWFLEEKDVGFGSIGEGNVRREEGRPFQELPGG
jgi:hypothetical protein